MNIWRIFFQVGWQQQQQNQDVRKNHSKSKVQSNVHANRSDFRHYTTLNVLGNWNARAVDLF